MEETEGKQTYGIEKQGTERGGPARKKIENQVRKS